MSVAVIGTGNIGTRVARRLAEGGVEVTVAAGSLDSARGAAGTIGHGVKAAEVGEAIQGADAVVFATWFGVTGQLLAENAEALRGKIVVDPSNNIAPDGDGFRSLNPEGVSAGQQLAALVPQARFVKAFGTLGADSLDVARTEAGDPVALYYAADDEKAGEEVADLIAKGGWAPVRAGGIDASARIEVFGDLHPFGGLNGRLLGEDEAHERLAGS